MSTQFQDVFDGIFKDIGSARTPDSDGWKCILTINTTVENFASWTGTAYSKSGSFPWVDGGANASQKGLKFVFTNCWAGYDTTWKKYGCHFASFSSFPTLASNAKIGTAGFVDDSTGKKYLWTSASGYYEV